MDWLAQGLALRTQKEKLHVCKFKHTLTHIPSHTLTHTHTFTHTHTHTHTHTYWVAGRLESSPTPPSSHHSLLNCPSQPFHPSSLFPK